MADVREANINVVGNWRMPVLGDFNERAISLEEEGETVNEMKSGNDRSDWIFGGMFKGRWNGGVGIAS